MSKYASDLATILVRDVFGQTSATIVEVLFRYGKLPLRGIIRESKLSEKVVSEALVVLIMHALVRFVTVEEGSVERTYYECLFEDVYPILRYGKEIQLTEKCAGSAEAGSLVQYLLMQGRQRIKDIVSALTDKDDINHDERTKTLNRTLKSLLNEQYLCTVNWWNLTPPDELNAKIILEEEKKLWLGATTSATLPARIKKEAGESARKRLSALKQDDKNMEGLKRKAIELVDASTHRSGKRRKVEEDDEEEEDDDAKLDFDENANIAVDHRKFPVLVRNMELVQEVHERLGPATAMIYQITLDEVERKLKTNKEGSSEIHVLTSDVAKLLPDPSTLSAFTDLVEPTPQTAGSSGSPSKRRKLGRWSDSDDELAIPEVKMNGVYRTFEQKLQYKMTVVAHHLERLADESDVFIRSSSGSDSESKGNKDDPNWTVNLLHLRRFIRNSEFEKIIEKKYGDDALSLVRLVAEKHQVDQHQFEKLILLYQRDLRAILSQLQAGGILEVQEIPKSTFGERAKNYNLWSFHESRAHHILLQDLYKTLLRIYQRIDEERARRQGILKKAQRTDVKGDLRRYLSRDEMRQYAEWRAVEERLLGQIARIDKSVMLLRDI